MIRIYKPEDLNAVLDINRGAFPPDLQCEDLLIEDLKDNYVWVYVDEFDYPYGFIKASDSVVTKKTGFIEHMAVCEAYQKMGIGGQLLDRAIDWFKAKRCKLVRLHVHVNNPAQKFYFDNGFRAKKVLKDLYYEGLDGIEMEKSL